MAMDIKQLLQPFAIDAPAIEVQELVLDSRDVAIHKAFLAIKGHQLDGREFIPQAISLGAKVIIAETEVEQEHGQMQMREQSLILYFYQLSQHLSALAVRFYQQPADKLSVVAVTGTNGKTSTVQLCAQMSQHLGIRAGSIGTLGAGPVGQMTTTINTTPDAISMQSLLADMSAQGVEMVSLEASSHALVQHRIQQLKTDIAVFTNLTRDHLDYHGTMQEYAKAKRLLLKQPGLKWAVINQEDIEGKNWLDELSQQTQAVLFGFEQPLAGYQGKYCVAKDVVYSATGASFVLESSWGEITIQSALLGRFNVLNLLAAIVCQLCLGHELSAVKKAVAQLRAVTGRMELFSQQDLPAFVVDYAHTPDALEQTLKALRVHTQGELWCVFGCGGDRDQGKRPLMGEIAERLADKVILTNDNSRSEQPQQIIQDILQGCRAPQHIKTELDRKQAIAMALDTARQGDIVLVAGKGHEDYQIIGEQKVTYDEREYIRQILKGKQQ